MQEANVTHKMKKNIFRGKFVHHDQYTVFSLRCSLEFHLITKFIFTISFNWFTQSRWHFVQKSKQTKRKFKRNDDDPSWNTTQHAMATFERKSQANYLYFFETIWFRSHRRKLNEKIHTLFNALTFSLSARL